MDKRSLYEAATLDAVLARIDSLTHDAKPGWGSMSAAQMFAHCAEIQEVANGKPLVGTPWFVRLLKGIIRKQVVGPKPYPRDLRTHPQYVVSDAREFGEQQERLRAALQAMFDDGPERAEKNPHPLFGVMTAEEKGWAMYKHLDHHLSQFGV